MNTLYASFRVLNYLLLALTCFLLSRKHRFVFFVLAVCSYPFYSLQYEGQFGIVVLFLWVAGALLEERGNNWLSALSFVFATLVKVTPAIIVVLFIVQKKWRWLAAYFAFLAAAIAIGIGIQGWPNHLLFWQNLRAISSGAASWHSLSIPSLMYNFWLGSPAGPTATTVVPTWLTIFAKVSSLAILAAVIWRRRTSSSVAAASLAIVPFSWCHYYVLALFPFVRKWRFSVPMVAAAVLIGTSLVLRIPTGNSVTLMAVFKLLVPLAALFLAFAKEPTSKDAAPSTEA